MLNVGNSFLRSCEAQGSLHSSKYKRHHLMVVNVLTLSCPSIILIQRYGFFRMFNKYSTFRSIFCQFLFHGSDFAGLNTMLFLCLFVCLCSDVNTSNRLSFVEQRVFNLIDVIQLLNDSLKHIQGNNMYVWMYDQSKFDSTWKHNNNKCVFCFLTHFSQTEHNILSSVTIIYFSDTYILAYLNLCYRLCYI